MALTNAQRSTLTTTIAEGVRADFLAGLDPCDLLRWIVAWQRRGGSLADAKILIEEMYRLTLAVGSITNRHAYRHWLERVIGARATEYE